MIKYKCPKCGANCNTSHCYDCDKDIPMSERFDDEISDMPAERLPFYARINGDTSCNAVRTSEYESETGFDKKIGNYLFVDTRNKIFKLKGDNSRYTFADLLDFELYENNAVIQKGGIGRAIVGGALFGEAGAIVGAATRKSQNVVNALYITVTLKSSGMKKITFINSSVDRSGITYRSARKSADEVASELAIIISEAQEQKLQQQVQDHSYISSAPQPTVSRETSPVMIADELLKLKQLLDMGVLTEDEFNQQKQKLLNR